MDEHRAMEVLVKVLTLIQTESGHETPSITEDTCPLDDLPDFDSLMGLVATGYVASELEIAIPDDVNIFVEESKKLSVREAVAKMCAVETPS